MTRTLHISDELSLPVAVGTQAVLVLGLRGSGKTNTAGALAEELLDAGQPIVVIDPTDAWWGLRTGYPVLIFGGSHADLPLQETDGKTIAEFQVTERVPFILSIRHLRKNAQRRFVTDFCEELYHLKGKTQYRAPLTVFLDEAPLFVPQRVLGEAARTVGAVEDLIARGRNAGFGVVLISQRSATVNADVRSQCDTIISHRLTAKLDRDAIKGWFEENASTEELGAILKSLALLKNGEAWVWAPLQDLMRRVQIRMRRTYDSSATPKPGQKLRPPKDLQQVDLDALKGKLAAAFAQARANDPAELKREIARLKKEVAKPVANAAAPAAELKAVERARREAWHDRDSEWKEKFAASERERKRLQRFYFRVQAAFDDQAPPAAIERPAIPCEIGRSTPSPPSVNASAEGVTRAQQKLLDALAWFVSAGIHAPGRAHVAAIAGVSPKSSAFDGNVRTLANLGLIHYPGAGRVAFTDAGRAAASRVESAANLGEFHLAWMGSPALSPAQRELLSVLLLAHPESLSRAELASRAQVSPKSSAFDGNVRWLASLGLASYPSAGHVVAGDVLFPEGL